MASISPSSQATEARSARGRIPCVLSIAGSDSGGGAGIQADLKAFARCGVHGMTAITAITAQNTVAVTAIHPVPAELILAQVRAVRDDLGVDAVKVGMLATAEIAPVDVVYVLTDRVDANLEFWSSHPKLGELMRSGRADVARYEIGGDGGAHATEPAEIQRPRRPRHRRPRDEMA